MIIIMIRIIIYDYNCDMLEKREVEIGVNRSR